MRCENRFLSGSQISVSQAPQSRIARGLHHCGMGEDSDLRMLFSGARHSLGAGEVLLANQYGDVLCVACQENALLRRGKAAAYDKNLLAGKKLAVAGGAVGYAPSTELRLAGKAYHTRMGSRGQKHSKAAVFSAPGLHGLDVPIQFKSRDLGQQELCAEALCLLPHCVRQFSAAGFCYAGIVHDLIRDSDLAAEMLLLYHQHAIACPGKIKGRRKPGRPSTYHDHIIELFHLHYSIPTRSRLGLRVSAPGCHLAGQTWSPCSATNWLA